MSQSKSIHILRYGRRMKFDNIQLPELKEKNQVLIKMAYAPINPSDIYYSLGVYGLKKQLPTTLGFEGVGTVVDSYQNNSQHFLNKKVACWASENINSGTWGDYFVTDTQNLFLINDQDQDNEKLINYSSPIINPGTVMGFLHKIKNNGQDSAIINAAYSQVGQMCIRTFKKNNIKTLCVVRNQEQVQKLLDIGATQVIVLQNENYQNLEKEVNKSRQQDYSQNLQKLKEFAHEWKIQTFFDAVGGNTASDILQSMPNGSTLVSYGAFELKKMELDSQLFVFQGKKIEGFWLTRFLESLNQEQQNDIYAYIHDNIQEDLKTQIYKQYPIDAYQNAIQEYMKQSTEKVYKGKLVLQM